MIEGGFSLLRKIFLEVCMNKSKLYILYSSKHTIFDIRIFQKFAKSLSYDFNVMVVNKPEKKIGFLREGELKKLVTYSSSCDIITVWKLLYKRKVFRLHLNDPIDFIRFLPLYFIFPKCFVLDFHENLPAQIMHKHYLGRLKKFFSLLSIMFINLIQFLPITIVVATPKIKELFKHKATFLVKNASMFNLVKKNGTTKSSPAFLYLGSLTHDRGAGYAELLLKNFPDIDFDYFGPELKEDVSFLKEYSNFIDHGFCDTSEIQKFVRHNHTGLFLCKPLPNYMESLPTKIFDYQALGIKYISPDFPYLVNYFNSKKGFFIDLAKIESNYMLISKILNENEFENDIKAENWESEIRKYMSFLKTN